MIYLACVSVGALIVFLLLRWQARAKQRTEQLYRDLAEQKAKAAAEKIHNLPLSDVVKRANERWGAKFDKTKGPRRGDN